MPILNYGGSGSGALGSIAASTTLASNVVRMMQCNGTGHTWTAAGAGLGSSNLNDTTDYYLGTQCVSLVSNGTTSSMFAKTTGLALDCTGRDLRIWFKYDSAVNCNNIQLVLGDNALTNTYTAQVLVLSSTTDAVGYQAQPGFWNVIDIPFSFFAVAGTPTRASIDTIRVNALAKSGQTTTFKLGGVATIAEDERGKWPNGVVTLCFDDSFDGQWNIARPYLDTYGDRATYFPIVNQVGVGQFTVARLQSLWSQGNEVGAHATSNTTHAQGLVAMTSAQRRTELATIRQWQLDNGFPSVSYAYPNGWWTPDVIGDLSRYYSTGRLAFGTYISNTRPALPYSVASIAGQVSSLTTYVDQAKTNKGWCVFTIHDVSTGGGGNATTTANFKALVDYCHTQGVPIRTMAEVINAAA
jgi:peptidoglycan/xylan/chitin deacetylase (PgdA/CDA1 family)